MIGAAIERLKHNRQHVWRQKRMTEVVARTGLRDGVRILDIGGTPDMWQHLSVKADITLLNLPDAPELYARDLNGYSMIEADFAADDFILDQRWDFAFCNSVLEHVPDPRRRQRFAETLQGVAPAWWVQVPAPGFPLEPHCHMPGWWHYPDALKQRLITYWRHNGKEFRADQMTTTVAIELTELQTLFPDGEIFTETVAGFTKSWSAFKPLDQTTA